MNDKQQITNFIKHVANNNFSTANKYLRSIINERLKNRIRKADSTLANKSEKTS